MRSARTDREPQSDHSGAEIANREDLQVADQSGKRVGVEGADPLFDGSDPLQQRVALLLLLDARRLLQQVRHVGRRVAAILGDFIADHPGMVIRQQLLHERRIERLLGDVDERTRLNNGLLRSESARVRFKMLPRDERIRDERREEHGDNRIQCDGCAAHAIFSVFVPAKPLIAADLRAAASPSASLPPMDFRSRIVFDEHCGFLLLHALNAMRVLREALLQLFAFDLLAGLRQFGQLAG